MSDNPNIFHSIQPQSRHCPVVYRHQLSRPTERDIDCAHVFTAEAQVGWVFVRQRDVSGDVAIRRYDGDAPMEQGGDIDVAKRIQCHGVKPLVIATRGRSDKSGPVDRWPRVAIGLSGGGELQCPKSRPFGFGEIEFFPIR